MEEWKQAYLICLISTHVELVSNPHCLMWIKNMLLNYYVLSFTVLLGFLVVFLYGFILKQLGQRPWSMAMCLVWQSVL